MNKLFFPLSVFLFLVHGLSMAQKPGDVRWTSLVNPSPNSDAIFSIKVQTDGKIVAAGNSYQGSYASIVIGRFDGAALDSSFGTNGIVTLALDSSRTEARAMEIQPDGKIVIAGAYSNKTTGTDFLLVRFNTDGSRDSTFGINGLVLTDFGAGFGDQANALTIQLDGKIVAAGTSGSALGLCRYNANGSLDKCFDLDGMVAGGLAGASCVKSQKDGKTLVGDGTSIMRLQPDGSRDYSFGKSGFASLSNLCNAMAILNDGKILATGGSWGLERLDTAGQHDNSFGNKGVVRPNGFYPSPTYSRDATAVCVQADGRILASGWAEYGSVGYVECFAVARFQSNGVPDSSFGTFGTVASPALPNFGGAVSLSAVINNNNEIVLGGANASGTNDGEWALVSYYLGSLLDVHKVPGANWDIIVVPNPAEEFARIHSAHIANGNWHLSLCDLTGRTLLSETVMVTNNAFDKSISLVNLPAAIYLVKLDNGISSMTVKLTKNR